MNVYCIIQHSINKSELIFVFEKSSRAYSTLDRLQNRNEKNITYEMKEMYVFAGEERKDVSKHKKD